MPFDRPIYREIHCSVSQSVAGIGGLPSNALAFAGVPLTFDSEILTFG